MKLAEASMKLRAIQPIVAIEYHPDHLLVGRATVAIADGVITWASDFVEWEKVNLGQKLPTITIRRGPRGEEIVE